ncbi:hypothetical protein P280DRAFT_539338 [Massarina eburnea CBS 473.64]|uniref:DNA polymerase n=1 Tax=Massarina eburnea CBS 473.64 TaxID=1395130 RepID=A0A6A6S9B8_9PLEO|nr:hypothetical protein P280DRAFT_539338 [Massarina eburnea CBS 473.64]
MDTFRFRLNCIDHYQATPTDLDPVLRRRPGPLHRQNAPQVPVVRVFGATETGQKVCAHIHGALPYLYLEYNGSLDKDEVNAYIGSLRASVDHALASTYRRNAYDGKYVYVGHISLIKGVPYYGYHVGYKFFLKVYLLNPLHMTRFADLLYQGAILNRLFQPYESHLQYLLQWMCDYNLYGCAYIDCAKVQFRGPVPEHDDIHGSAHKWHDASIPANCMADADQYPRQSHCTLEIDVCAQDILNRHELQARPMHHAFNEQSLELRPEEKYVPSMAGLWKDEARRRKLRMGLSDPSSSPFPPEVLVSMSADTRSDKGGWIHEEEFRELVDGLIKTERGKNPAATADKFFKPVAGEDTIRTAVESVEDLYPENLPIEDASSEEPLEIIPFVEEREGINDIVDDEGDTEAQSDAEELPPMDPLSISEAHLQSSVKEETVGQLTNESIDLLEDEENMSFGDSATPPKRHHNFDSEMHGKRQRVAATQKVRRVSFKVDHLDEESEDTHTSPEEVGDGPPRASQLSQVVKNANAPETILRLSQSGYSNSQDTPKTPATKHLGIRTTHETPTTPWSNRKTSPLAPGSSSPEAYAKASALAQQLETSSRHRSRTLYFGFLPPTPDDVEGTLPDAGLAPMLYQDAYYSNEKDVPDRPREYAGREFKLQSTTLPYLPPFDPTGRALANFGEHPSIVRDKTKELAASRIRSQKCNLRNWEISTAPPSFENVAKWVNEEHKQEKASRKSNAEGKRKRNAKHLSQIEGPTQKDDGFKYAQKKKSTNVKHETQYMSIMSLEVHANSRGTLVPDPAEDEIQSIFWCIQGAENAVDDAPSLGIICLSDGDGIARRIARQVSAEVEYEEDELDLINRVVDIVRYLDPDIMTGYEVHNSSWGYLIERARMKYEYNLCDEISRIKTPSYVRFGKEADRWGFTHTSTIRVTGRHMINIWRAMRGELNLLQYTIENVVFHLLHKRIPHYQHSDLTAWYTSSKPRDLAKVLNHFLSRVQLNLDILEANEIVPRTSEQARLLGVDFFSVISRGSQFKVESTMFRIAKPENFILVSPSRKQVGQQNALECLPLVMEPQSAFYPSPLLVLDFQSLYPSVMIAYNYCYSTCLGRIVPWRGQNKMGFMDFEREPQLLELVKDHINIAPNGLMYVKPEMRKSLLAKMLGEILETRVMVKSGMKVDKDDKPLQQLLNNRQLALKLLANVTYGYTSASFSGRMPCSEIADSIVQTGRETLEKAIALIHSVEKWGAEVVYGDTDSLFIYLKGRTRDQAFTIGEEIAEAVTKANPRPIKLKFEKVYHPCILMAKKRYVGFKYETRCQKEPEFDAKGIETVRRDGTPAEQKIEEVALKTLFRTSDLSQVKRYFLSQCTKIMEGRISIQDFLFAKEVKLGTYSDRAPPPPGALIATKRMLADPRTEPQYGERIPYVVITGAPGARLIDRCVSPEVLLQNEHVEFELDAEYYISKNIIPPLERIFNLVGANIRQWYDEMPKIQRIRNITLPMYNPNAAGGPPNLGKTLESYLKASTCLVCRSRLAPPAPTIPGTVTDTHAMLPLCVGCLKKPAITLLRLQEKIWSSEKKVQDVERICRSCSSLAFFEEIKCDSRDCPTFYTRVKEKSKLNALREGPVGVVEVLRKKEAEEDLMTIAHAVREEGGDESDGSGSASGGSSEEERDSEGLEW